MDSNNFNPSDYVSFVEGAGTDRGRVLLHVKVPASSTNLVAKLCGRHGLHAMRFYRDAFARGLRETLTDAAYAQHQAHSESGAKRSARSADAGSDLESAMAGRLRQLEAETRAHRATASDDSGDAGF